MEGEMRNAKVVVDDASTEKGWLVIGISENAKRGPKEEE